MNGSVIRSDRGYGQRPKWFNSPVTVHKGILTEIRHNIPSYRHRGFGLTQPEKDYSRLNERFDTIVRLHFGSDQSFIPAGIVSKDYTIVQHTAVLDVVTYEPASANIFQMKWRANSRLPSTVNVWHFKLNP